MALSRTSKLFVAALTAATLAGTVESAVAKNNRYTGTDITGVNRSYRYHHRYGPGVAIGGAALGIAGAAAAGIAADRYYNGYPAYSYGPGYGSTYGYDYVPDHGYYGPY